MSMVIYVYSGICCNDPNCCVTISCCSGLEQPHVAQGNFKQVYILLLGPDKICTENRQICAYICTEKAQNMHLNMQNLSKYAQDMLQ